MCMYKRVFAHMYQSTGCNIIAAILHTIACCMLQRYRCHCCNKACPVGPMSCRPYRCMRADLLLHVHVQTHVRTHPQVDRLLKQCGRLQAENHDLKRQVLRQRQLPLSGRKGPSRAPWKGTSAVPWKGPPRAPWRGPPRAPWKGPPRAPWTGRKGPPRAPWTGRKGPPRAPWTGRKGPPRAPRNDVGVGQLQFVDQNFWRMPFDGSVVGAIDFDGALLPPILPTEVFFYRGLWIVWMLWRRRPGRRGVVLFGT